MSSTQKIGAICALIVLACSSPVLRGEPTEKYAVLVTGVVQETPPKITLNWEQDEDLNANPSYTIYRKAASDTSWGAGTNLGNVLTFADTSVTVGSAYEYQIVKTTALDYSGYGYIYAGIRAETVPESRGKLVLVVDNTFTVSLAPELARLEQDLAGDGWTVIRHDVVRDDESITGEDLEFIGLSSEANRTNAAGIRNTIIADYSADPANVKAVLLFGRVPIFRSGNLDPDDHLARPMPADGFYGEMDGTWTTATSYLPSDLELQVGRVDLSRMSGKAVFNGPDTFPSELELLRQYLNKDHNFRHGIIDVQRQAVVGESFGSYQGWAFGASGWRNFAPFFGTSNITRAPINTTPGSWQEMVCDTEQTGETYLWVEGDGAGAPTGMGSLGTRGQYNQVWSRDLVGVDESGSLTPDIKAVFTIFYGSWFGEWDRTDDLLRSVLASRTMGLTSSWSGVPHHYYHHMALGETVGYGIRLSQNNGNTLYKNQVQQDPLGVHVALMGDPTLRMHVVKPVTKLICSGSGNVSLSWTASADSGLLGCNVYRGSSKLNVTPISGTTFSDTPPVGVHTYAVRAVKLETSSSGTYVNLSQAAFVSSGAGGNPAPTVAAGLDKTIVFPGSVSLLGVASDDCGWSKVSGPGNVYFKDVNAPVTQAEFQLTGTYTLRLTANSGAAVLSDDVVVTVIPASSNAAPVVDAGADQTVTLPNLVKLSGTVSEDGLPNPVTVNSWSVGSGPGSVIFGETVARFSTSGLYTLRLSADDGATVSFDEVVVTVNPAPGYGSEFVSDADTIALFRFNNDYTDSSGNGYDLTATGGVTRTGANIGWMSNPAGNVARFSSLGDTLTVSIPDSEVMASSSAMISIEARFYLRNYATNNGTPNAPLIELSQEYDAHLSVFDSRYHSPPGPSVFGNQSVAVSSTDWGSEISTDVWHDLLITFDASDTVRCYLDGEQIGVDVSAPMNRGRGNDWALTLGNFDGDLDEVRVSSAVRSPSANPYTSYAKWEAEYSVPGGPEADPDEDGLSNLLEYALSFEPVILSESGNYLSLQYTRPAFPDDLFYEPQVSADYLNWEDNTVEMNRISNPDLTETITFRDSVPRSAASRRFIRLKVHSTLEP
jgi:hypothetical protein